MDLKKWAITRDQEQRNNQGEAVTQQRDENANTIANQRVGERMQCQIRGERTEEKDNVLQYLPSGATQVNRKK